MCEKFHRFYIFRLKFTYKCTYICTILCVLAYRCRFCTVSNALFSKDFSFYSKVNLMKIIHTFTVAALSAAILTACGGGSSTSTTTTSTTATTPVVAIDVRDPYVGTWVVNCATSTVVKAGNAFVKQKVTTTLAKAANSTTVLSAVLETKFYAPTDVGCTGPVLSTETISNAKWTIGTATKSMTLSPNPVIATAVNVSAPAVGGIAAGNTITISGLTYPGNYYTTALNNDLFVYSPETGKLYTAPASASAFDPIAYPVMIKQ